MASFDDKLKEMVKNDIGQLRRKSIGKKCKELINKCVGSRKYCDLAVMDFFNECYKIRSIFVHVGTTNLSKINKYDNELKRLVIDVILEYEKRNGI